MKTLTQSAQTAAAIRAELKEKFPSIKFTIRSSNFSMGNSVDVSWNLGMITETIDKIIGKYQYGHFDGMVDMYENSNCRDDIPQAKFVHCQRQYQTQEEIENNKLKWNDPKRIDLYAQEKTLNHIIAKDLCVKMRIEYVGLNTIVPKEFAHMVRGYACKPPLSALIYQLLNKAELMTGYHGIKNEISEEYGTETSNSFIVY